MPYQAAKNVLTNSDITKLSKNTVSDQGVLINFVSENFVLNCSFKELLASFKHGLDKTDDSDKTVETATEFLKDLLPSPGPALALEHDGDTDPTIFDGLTRWSNTSFRNRCFPNLGAFNEDAATSITRYPVHEMATVIESLSPSHQQELQAWAAATHSQLLWIDGCLSATSSSWTADMALEVIGAATSAIACQAVRDGVVVCHFCNTTVEGAKRTPGIVIQDVIFQLIGTRAEYFTKSDCRKHRLTETRFLEASRPGQFNNLWDLCMTCVLVSKIKSFVVVLSDLDDLHRDMGRCNEDGLAFQKLVDGLIELSQTDKVLYKILVTTKPSAALDCFSAKTPKRPRQTLLKLATPPNRRRLLKSPDRKFRLPIEAVSLIETLGINQPDNSKNNMAHDMKTNDSEIAKSTTNKAFDDEDDSELNFSDASQLDLALDTDSNSESENDLEGGITNQQGEAVQANVGAVLRSPIVIGLEHDEDSEDSISYSDLEREPTSNKNVEDVRKAESTDNDVINAMLWSSDESE